MGRKKVLFICEVLNGGVRRHLLDILFNLDRKKYELYLIYSDNRADELFIDSIDKLKSIDVRMYKIDELTRNISMKKDLISLVKTISFIKKIKPDIIHCHSSKAGAIGRLASQLCGVKKVFYTPNAYIMQNPQLTNLKKTIFRNIERYLGSRSVTINVSKNERSYALDNKLTTESKSLLIYNGTGYYDEDSKNDYKNSNDKFIIGTVARLDEQKDPWTFYNIASQIVNKYDHIEFIYLGEGPYKESLQEEIISNNLSSKIKFLGYYKNPISIMKEFNIYLSTSLYEGLPYSLIEAASLGLPIIATDVIGNNEMVKDHYNGLLFQPKNILEGVEKLEYIINNPSCIESFSMNSHLLYKSHFTVNHMIENLQKAYENYS